jgi:YfiH family protein
MTAIFAQSPTLTVAGISHGFFGRQGGFSSGPYAGLNTSESAGDDLTLVARNRAQAAAALGFSADALATVRQVHSNHVLALTSPPQPGERHEADAMVTNQGGLLLGVLTADCAPILLADPEAGVVAAAHAGWKGAAGGIVYATVLAMTRLGADPARIRAVIGPTISMRNYEVGPETAAEILRLDAAAARHIAIPDGSRRERFDIPGLLHSQLAETGLGTVDDLKLCTYADPERWFSYRYARHHGTTTGRQIALIGLT